HPPRTPIGHHRRRGGKAPRRATPADLLKLPRRLTGERNRCSSPPWLLGRGGDPKALVNRNWNVVARIVEGKNHLDLIQFGVTNESNSSFRHFEIESLPRICGPIIQTLKISARTGVTQKCSHTLVTSPVNSGGFTKNPRGEPSGV